MIRVVIMITVVFLLLNTMILPLLFILLFLLIYFDISIVGYTALHLVALDSPPGSAEEICFNLLLFNLDRGVRCKEGKTQIVVNIMLRMSILFLMLIEECKEGKIENIDNKIS